MNEQEMKDRFERIEGMMEKLAAMQLATHNAIDGLVTTINRFVDDTHARMGRTEANLDALIRAITAEHSNGKKKQ